uniref:Rho GTPase-activating protein 32 n=1 Tax=Cyprinus carpio TaxID=7962 RepID=A0A8C1YPN0_CYPCA
SVKDGMGLRPGRHPEEDDIVPELARSIHPRERPDWEETISAMVRSQLLAVSMLFVHHSLTSPHGHFPKLAECAHFHYENVDFGTIQLTLADEQTELTRNGLESKEPVYLVQIFCQGRSWIVRRSYEDFRVLDKHLHLCIYDRRFSQLPELPRFDSLRERAEAVSQMLMAYLSRLSAIVDNKINCGPALTWMEVDNKGNHLLVHEESSINVPAIAAAHVIKRYIAQAADELSFEVGDIVSVIDMPPKEDTTWWRGKHGFQVGFFPSECVELINDKVPQSVTNSVPKPVSKKHGKLITFLRTFMKSRPTKQKLKQRGILRERVFGCDLGEHLLNSGHDVPQVLKSCTEFIEKHGVVDGMYRLSGIASNIQKLRHEFDSEQIPDLTKDVYIQDIHCVGSLCKLYFRELPNPLLTYQLYEKFSEAVSAATDEERLIKIHDVIQQLPPPHYRTLEFLMRHLSHLATFSYITNMHTKNLAIVWAPNLLRSKQIESACFSGTAAFMEVRIQSVVVEFILNHVDVLFSPKLSSLIREGTGHNSLSRPKSLLVPSPSTKLLTLEEAQARTQAQINSPITADSKYIEVGEGPAALQGKFHTVIEFPTERKRQPIKSKKSPVGSWRSFFNLGKSSSMSKRKLHRNPSEPNELKAMALAGGRGDTGTLRSAKSEESLTSLHNVEGESKVYRPRRPRSSSDALSASFNGDLLDSRQHCNSYDNLGQGDSDGDDGPICVPALISPPRSADDVDLSPPDIGMASLDFDPMSFQCSLPLAETSIFSLDTDESSLKRSPASASGSEPVSPVRAKVTSHSVSPDHSPALKDRNKLPPASFSEKAPVQSLESSEKSAVVTPLSISESTAFMIRKAPESTVIEYSQPPQPAFSLFEFPLFYPSIGAVALDSPKGNVPVSSVPLIPPPPPPKNAARMLALALVESAQQATILSQRQSSGPPTPVSPVKPQELLETMDWPPHPSLPSQPSLEEAPQIQTQPHAAIRSQPQVQPHSQSQAQPQFQPKSQPNARVAPTPAAPLDPVEKPWEAIKPVHPKADSAPQHHTQGVTPPTPPVRSIESKLAMAALCNTETANPANFHAILETSMRGSVEETPPQSHLSHHRASTHQGHGDGRYNTIGPRSYHQSIKSRGPLRSEYISPGSLHHSHGYSQVDGPTVYPTIRRVHSLHVPPTGIRSTPVTRTEVPPDDELFYYQRPVYHCKSHQPASQADYHVTQLQPYFENGRVQYRYSPYSGSHVLDAPFYDVDHYGTIRLRHVHSFSGRDSAPLLRSGAKSGGYNYLSRHFIPLKEHSFVSRDMPPYGGSKGSVYFAWDPEEAERLRIHSIRRESRARQKVKGSVMSQYDNIGPYMPMDIDMLHLRSKSDPGKTVLMAAESKEARCNINPGSQHAPRHLISDPDVLMYMETEKHCQGNGMGDKTTKQGSSRTYSSIHSHLSQLPPRSLQHLPEGGYHDLKFEPGEKQPSSKHWQEHSKSRTTQPRYERSDLDRHICRVKATSSASEDEQAVPVKPAPPPKPERSHSVRERQHYNQSSLPTHLPENSDHSGSYSHQSQGQRQSAITLQSHYDNLDDYHLVPQSQTSLSNRGGSSSYHSPGFSTPHSNLAYSTALGQGAFIQAELSVQRPETEINAE